MNPKSLIVSLTGALTLACSPFVAVPVSATSAPKPSCVVSLSPTATETLFAIGAGRQVQAVDNDSNFPLTGLPKKRVDALNPSVEAVIGVCAKTATSAHPLPDLVVISYDANNIKENLTALGVHVVEQDAATSVTDATNQILALGRLTGHTATAGVVARSVTAKIAADVSKVQATASRLHVQASSISTYYELDPTLYSLTSDTFVGALLHSLGVTNIADAVAQSSDYGYPQLNSEYVVSASPKLIFLADTKCCSVSYQMVANRTGFSSVKAVLNHHVVGLDDDVASRWGPRLGQLMDALTNGVLDALAQKNWK